MNEQAKWLRICGNTDRDGCDHLCPYYDDDHCPRGIMYEAADTIEMMQREIALMRDQLPVRCGECRYTDDEERRADYEWCMQLHKYVPKDWYCKDGKRKDGIDNV